MSEAINRNDKMRANIALILFSELKKQQNGSTLHKNSHINFISSYCSNIILENEKKAKKQTTATVIKLSSNYYSLSQGNTYSRAKPRGYLCIIQ